MQTRNQQAFAEKNPGLGLYDHSANKLSFADRSIHDWYRFVLSFPPHLVRDYLTRFQLNQDSLVVDPFCGTGTTVVECRKLRIPSLGVEANPMARFAAEVKVDWTPDPEGLLRHSAAIAEEALAILQSQGIIDDPLPLFVPPSLSSPQPLKVLSPEQSKLLLTNSISPLPLHKTLVLLECLEHRKNSRYHSHQLLALAKSLVGTSSNLHFGPEVGVGQIKSDAPVVAPWLAGIRTMANDLRSLDSNYAAAAQVIQGDSRNLSKFFTPRSIDAVITSPPYPNEKDYTRTTRLESVLLGFIKNRVELQDLKRTLVRSNTRSVYINDTDDQWILDHKKIKNLADAIEARRIELGKTSGFERMYARVTKLYFGGMARHLASLRPYLRQNAHLAYVVGDQASYLRVMIRTGQLLAEIAQSLGFELVGIDLFRTRLATATKEQLREEVVVLRWPGE